jgi:hypothetical protein
MTPDLNPPDAPRGALLSAAILCGLVGVSSLAGAGAAIAARPRIWFLLGFECVVVTAAVLGFLVGRGRYRQGPALALACVAGSVAVASYLGYLGSGRTILGIGLMPFLAFRLGIAGAIGMVAAWIVLSRRPGIGLPRLFKGLVIGLVLAVLGAGVWTVRARIAALPDIARIAGAVVLFVVFTALLATSVHLIIRAFESGRDDDAEGAAGASDGQAARPAPGAARP